MPQIKGVTSKVLNPMEWRYSDFPIKLDVPPSWPLWTLRIEEVLRRADQNIRMMARQSYPDIWDGIPFQCPAGCLAET